MGREEIFIDLGGGAARQKRRLLYMYAKMSEIRNFTVFAPCDGHAGWLADIKMYIVAGGMTPCGGMAKLSFSRVV